jgi:hypothetical protein
MALAGLQLAAPVDQAAAAALAERLMVASMPQWL